MHFRDRKELERTLALEASSLHQSPEDHAEWLSAGYTCRILCSYNKFLVVWQETGQLPRILGHLRFMNLEADTRSGLGVCIESTKAGEKPEQLWVDHTPTRLFGMPIFGHVPYVTEVTYTPEPREPGKYILRFPFVLKTKSNPDYTYVGDTYVSQLSEFRSRFPEFSNLACN